MTWGRKGQSTSAHARKGGTGVTTHGKVGAHARLRGTHLPSAAKKDAWKHKGVAKGH